MKGHGGGGCACRRGTGHRKSPHVTLEGAGDSYFTVTYFSQNDGEQDSGKKSHSHAMWSWGIGPLMWEGPVSQKSLSCPCVCPHTIGKLRMKKGWNLEMDQTST